MGHRTGSAARLIVTSATYRQSSRVTPALLEKDPENRLLAHGPRFRLPAEMVRDNPLMTERLVVGGDRVRLSDITVPFLHVLASRDHIIPEASAAPLIGLVGSPDKHELRLDAGHVGLLVGKTAAKTTLPTIIDFLKQRSRVTT